MKRLKSLCALPIHTEVAKGYIHVEWEVVMETICMEIFLISTNNDYDTLSVASINQVEL